jgi:ectoine hydroxylase-related dioxygenase (phytanoyl-CoA dioxygenase family)
MKTYGINARSETLSKEETHLEELNIQGYTVIEDVLSEEELTLYRNELDRIYAIQENELGKSFLKQINEEYLARALSAYSILYTELACKENMISLVKRVLGDYFIIHLQNGIINMPNEEHHQSSWHRDLPYQNWISSEPIGVNIFYCLDDFNAQTGGTILLPYSHKVPFLPSDEYVAKHGIQVEVKAGSVLFFDSMLFHRAGYNSSNNIRRGVNTLYGRAILRQQIDLPSIMPTEFISDPFRKMLFGVDAKSPDSVSNFRKLRFEKKQNKY